MGVRHCAHGIREFVELTRCMQCSVEWRSSWVVVEAVALLVNRHVLPNVVFGLQGPALGLFHVASYYLETGLIHHISPVCLILEVT